jgi:hypothetical protein
MTKEVMCVGFMKFVLTFGIDTLQNRRKIQNETEYFKKEMN